MGWDVRCYAMVGCGNLGFSFCDICCYVCCWRLRDGCYLGIPTRWGTAWGVMMLVLGMFGNVCALGSLNRPVLGPWYLVFGTWSLVFGLWDEFYLGINNDFLSNPWVPLSFREGGPSFTRDSKRGPRDQAS
jgi:hypothetical protein